MHSDLAIILSIVGAFGTLALGVNAFFLKGIYTDLNAVKISFIEHVGKKELQDEKISNLEKADEKKSKDIHKLNNRVQEMEMKL